MKFGYFHGLNCQPIFDALMRQEKKTRIKNKKLVKRRRKGKNKQMGRK